MIIRLKGIKKVKSKGRVYYYHRATNTRILSEYGTAGFIAEINALDAKKPAPRDAHAPNTWNWLVQKYRTDDNPEWAKLASSTQADYNRVFNWLVDPAGDKSKLGLRGLSLDKIDTAGVYDLRDVAAKRGYRFANKVMGLISSVWNWGLRRRLNIPDNPVVNIAAIQRPSNLRTVNRAWTQNELKTVLAAAKPHIALPVAIAANTALREGDVLDLRWSKYDGDALAVIQSKTQAKTEGELYLPIHKDLRPLLINAKKAAEAKMENDRSEGAIVVDLDPIICLNSRGKPWTADGFKTSFFKLIRKLESEKKIGTGLTFHGLRHTVATTLADAGADDRTIAAMTGHKSLAMVQRYTAKADQKRRAKQAMKLLEGTE